MARPDFPRTLAEFQSRFATEEHCRRYLVACRWPGGYQCPRCAHAGAYELGARDLFQCRSCRHQVSVTAGTVLHRTRLPLHLWFAAAYLVTTHTPGFSAVQLQRQLGLARYETAWTMLQEAAPRHAAPGARPDLGDRGSGRDLRRRRRGRAPRRASARQHQGDRRRCGRGAWPRLRPHTARRRRGSVRGVAGPVRRGIGPTRQHGADRWLAKLRPAPQDLRSSTVHGGEFPRLPPSCCRASTARSRT